MGKKQSYGAPWVIFLQSVLVTLGVYLLGQLLLTLLLVKGTLPEDKSFPIVAVWCLLSVLLGGSLAARRSRWGTLPAALLTAGIFAGILILVGLSFWESVSWTGKGGILLLCILCGGFAAGLLAGRPRRKRKRK